MSLILIALWSWPETDPRQEPDRIIPNFGFCISQLINGSQFFYSSVIIQANIKKRPETFIRPLFVPIQIIIWRTLLEISLCDFHRLSLIPAVSILFVLPWIKNKFNSNSIIHPICPITAAQFSIADSVEEKCLPLIIISHGETISADINIFLLHILQLLYASWSSWALALWSMCLLIPFSYGVF